MTSLLATVLLAAGMVVVALKARINYTRLPELLSEPVQHPDVTVVIPARNEEKNIERVVRSFPDVPVVVVDDASTDFTAERARAAGAIVVSAPPLPAGEMGKPNACHHGASTSETRWLLFVDADTWFHPTFAARLVRYAEEEKLEMVSAFLRQHTVTISESVLLPYAFALYFAGVNAANVNSPASQEALANGQCLLVRRDAYQRLGGHKAVARSVIEDVHLARIAKQKQVLSRVIRAERFGNVRMYDGLRAIWRGFEKNSFRFLLVNPLSGLIVVAASIVYTSYLPGLLWLAERQEWLAAALFAAVPGIALSPWYGGLAAIWLTPPAVYLFQLIALTGMVKTLTRRKTDWKGRLVG